MPPKTSDDVVTERDERNLASTILGCAVINCLLSWFTQPTNHMESGLKYSVVKPISLEKIVELQNDQFILPPGSTNSVIQVLAEGIKFLLDKHPKELLVCFSGMKLFGSVYNFGNTLVIFVAIVLGILYLANTYLDKWFLSQIMSKRNQLNNHQLNTVKHLSATHAETVMTVGGQALQMYHKRNETAIALLRLVFGAELDPVRGPPEEPEPQA